VACKCVPCVCIQLVSLAVVIVVIKRFYNVSEKLTLYTYYAIKSLISVET